MVSVKELYSLSLDKWGIDKQQIQAVQELAELQKVLTKLVLTGDEKKYIGELCEEITDVQIMLDQLRQFYDINGPATDWHKEAKLKRLASRLDTSISYEEIFE
jgi:hypothetical protein